MRELDEFYKFSTSFGQSVICEVSCVSISLMNPFRHSETNRMKFGVFIVFIIDIPLCNPVFEIRLYLDIYMN